MGSAFTSIKQGLEEAITFAKGNCPQAKVYQFSPVDVKNVRTKVGMTQIEFAATFGISVSVPCAIGNAEIVLRTAQHGSCCM
ncbi:hypothetical protein RCF98_12830 [Thiothrix lacustris]|uniref:HTH cro/C1-type domain-containing protein n=1 Tax=Thiothrix lacustris TaxID=525917 RepID=A0ABY9MMR7_9GAMM|nr:hypothetical protein [Thiothrix lacustris]WML89853.1 hypothetical protein RCF98_12830 [Thiothrix lacustris]